MQVVVATDEIAGWSSLLAGEALATGWPAADVTVVPLGEAGNGFAQAAADQLGADLHTTMLGEAMMHVATTITTALVRLETADSDPGEAMPVHASSVALGRAVRAVLAQAGTPERLLVDLAGPAVHDGGAGLLFALGARADVALDAGVAGLSDLTELDLGGARALLAGTGLVGVVPADQVDQLLVGLRGITSMRRGPEADPADLLKIDADLARFARSAAPEQVNRPGAGACGGLGFAVLALGGRLVTGPRWAFSQRPVQQAVRTTELVVTGCTRLDFARRGGGVLAEAARVAAEQLAPCIAVAGEVLIGGRELRTMGIESAYAVADHQDQAAGGDLSEQALLATARRVGRSWRW